MTIPMMARTFVRTATLAAAATLAILAAGCGEKCRDETPPLRSNGVPSCPTMASSAPVTVQIGVCPKCDQGTPRCVVNLDNVASSGDIQLEPLSEVCQSGSCPIVDPTSCPVSPLSCSFTSPAAGSYEILVVDENGTAHTAPFTVASSGATSCTL